MHRRLSTFATAAVIGLTVSACGFTPPSDLSELGQAEFGLKGGPGALQARMCRMISDVELDEAQLAEIRALHAGVQSDLAEVKQAMQDHRADMRALWSEENPDAEAITAVHAETAPLRAQAFARLVDFYIKVLGLLSDEQLASVHEKMATCSSGSDADADASGRGRGSCGKGGAGGKGDMGGEGKSGRGGAGGGGQNELGLSYDQMARIFTLKETFKNDIAAVKDELKENKSEMCELWSAEPPEAAAITGKYSEMEPKRAEIVERMVAFRIDVFEVFTPEQRELISEKMASKQQRSEADHREACAFLTSDSAPASL